MQGATGSNVFAGILSGIGSEFAVVKAMIDAENIIRKEGDATLATFKKIFGYEVTPERRKEHDDLLNKVIEIDFPEVEISDQDFEKMAINIEVYKCLNLIRKVTQNK